MRKGTTRLCFSICLSFNAVVVQGFDLFSLIEELKDQVTETPSLIPSYHPSAIPTLSPSAFKSETPSHTPSLAFSNNPSVMPSLKPSNRPSDVPTITPTVFPTRSPSTIPSISPSISPSHTPSQQPSLSPSLQPSAIPSSVPSQRPSKYPTALPTLLPSPIPSSHPSLSPSFEPSLVDSLTPSTFINKLTQNGTTRSRPTANENWRNVTFITIGSSLLALVALVGSAVLYINYCNERNTNDINLEDFEEDDDFNLGEALDEVEEALEEALDDVEDDESHFNPSTIQTEKTSIWRKRMENILEEEGEVEGVSQIYPNSVFQASTIRSEGSWMRRTALPTTKMQSSVMDIDYFEEKPIPDHVMCVQSESRDEI